jgi:hypothetical protein
MTLKQSTLEEIIESERKLMLTADQRYGNYSRHTRECAIFLSRCITSVDPDRMMFARFFSLMKKQLLLAVLSTLRLHKVQAMMNLRQVMEAGAAAAFAIANPEPEHFAKTDQNGLIDPSQDLTKKRYQWLARHFPAASQAIKEKKDAINNLAAHANIVREDRFVADGQHLNCAHGLAVRGKQAAERGGVHPEVRIPVPPSV